MTKRRMALSSANCAIQSLGNIKIKCQLDSRLNHLIDTVIQIESSLIKLKDGIAKASYEHKEGRKKQSSTSVIELQRRYS